MKKEKERQKKTKNIKQNKILKNTQKLMY